MRTPTPARTDFDHFATTYQQLLNDSVSLSGESVEYFADMKARYLQRSLGACFTGNILDYGCGVGMLTHFLVKQFPECRVDGYDPSERSLSEIPAAIAMRGLFTNNLSKLRSDYDLVVLANVMHHVPPGERQELVSRLVSRMAPGGRLFVFEHNPLNPLTRRSVRLCPFDADAVLLWPGELRGYLSGAGLRLESRDYIVFFPRLLSWLRPLEPVLKWCAAGAQYVTAAALPQRESRELSSSAAASG
jgi:SAM-dependent methyltransferase